MLIAAFQETLMMMGFNCGAEETLQQLDASSYLGSDMEPPIAVRLSEEELASDFVFRLLRQPHIQRPGGEVYELEVGVISAFITPPDDEQPVFVQHAVIATEYGAIYLHTVLQEDGSVPQQTHGVQIDFDNEALRIMVVGIAAGDSLFSGLPTPAFNFINTINEMEFLLGNPIKGIPSITEHL